jgi:hypothetical protein
MEPILIHKILHLGTIVLVSLLAFVSLVTYFRYRKKKYIVLSLAFLLFALREYCLFFEAVLSYRCDVFLPLIHTEMTHFLSLIILVLFSLAVFSRI